jgi:hypothetical protein
MSKLFVALIASAFALVLGSALADDKTPAQPVDQAKPKADTDAAKANAKAMTPEEEVAAKKAKRAAEREKALSRAERNAGPSGPYEAWTVEDAHRVDRELSTKRKPEKDAAKAAAAKMTPEERAAKRKAAAKRQTEIDAKNGSGQ